MNTEQEVIEKIKHKKEEFLEEAFIPHGEEHFRVLKVELEGKEEAA